MTYRWLKLNFYPMLLTLLLCIAGTVLYFCPAMHNRWILIPAVCLWIAVAFMTLRIYSHYQYKVEVLEKMIEKGSRHFDYRLFYPYLGSPCMRSVVYFSLCELGRQEEYWKIKRKYAEPTPPMYTPYRVFAKYENGITKFYRQEIRTGNIEEID